MKKIILISVVIHALLIAVLSPVLKTRMEFDEKKENQRTAEVKAREAERKQQDRILRDKQRLDEKTAKLLKREAELKKREKISQQVRELRKKRDEIMGRRLQELERFQERQEKDILVREQAAMEKLIRKISAHINSAKQNAAKVGLKDSLVPVTPKNAEDLEKTEAEIANALDEIKDNHAVRNELLEADKYLKEAMHALSEIDEKTDMPVMNNTDTATADYAVTPAFNGGDSASEMYKEAQELEKQIAAAKADIDAADQAVSDNTSYSEARRKAMDTIPSRPNLEPSLGGGVPGTVGELNEFRENLNRAENEMQDMNARADSALGRSKQKSLAASSFASEAARNSAAQQSGNFGQVVDMRKDESGEGAEMAYAKAIQTLHLDEGKIISSAMPGRRFTEASTRKGWLYLDTWYVVGPWENKSTVDYTIKHPPEFGIDFDAKYYDGKFADRAGHPNETLKWEFYQSDQVRCQPPTVYAASTYYAYTDVWFEEARDMLIAVASDDASSVWLNGQLIWQDVGQSAWQLGEGYRKVRFNKGYNDVLVRIENGPSHCVWSVVLCPPEVLDK